MGEIRTLLLDHETKADLCRLSQSDYGEELLGIQELLPEALSPKEINSIGLQVATLAETISPSRDGYSGGRKVEKQVIRSIGLVASLGGDTQTLQSAKTHLRNIHDFIGVGLLWLDGKIGRDPSPETE